MGVRKYSTPEEAHEAKLRQMREYARLYKGLTRKVPDGWRYKRHGSEYDSRIVNGGRAEYSPEKQLFRCYFELDCLLDDTEKEFKKLLINRVREAGFTSRVLVLAEGPLKRRGKNTGHYMDCQVYAVHPNYPSVEQIQTIVTPYTPPTGDQTAG